MTAGTAKSAEVSGFDSIPVTLQQGSKQGDAVRSYRGVMTVATTNTDDIGDIMKIVRIPANLRITGIICFNTDLDTGSNALAADLGAYNSATGAVISSNCFASASGQLAAADTGGTNLAFKAGGASKVGLKAWEIAGLSADPGVAIDIAFTVTTAAGTGATGTIVLDVHGTLDN
jgi:hypothetical protein